MGARDDLAAPPVSPEGAEAITHLMRPLAALLAAPDVTELCINRPGEVFVEANSQWTVHKDPSLDLTTLQGLAKALATYTAQVVNRQNPLLSGSLPTRERVQAVLPPAVEEGLVSLTIRKPSTRSMRLQELASQGVFSRVRSGSQQDHSLERELLALKDEHLLEFLRRAVQERLTIVVSGATGSGKTTFMKALMQEVPTSERLVTIEDSRELWLPDHQNKVHLLYSKGDQGVANVDSKDLLHACMRMRPDRVFLAELRGADAFDFLDVTASGHPGSITSTHGGSPADAFARLADMVRESPRGANKTTEDIKLMLLRSIDVIVQFDRDSDGRHAKEIYFDPAAKRRAKELSMKVGA